MRNKTCKFKQNFQTETVEVEGQNEFRPIYGIKNMNKDAFDCAAGGIFFK